MPTPLEELLARVPVTEATATIPPIIPIKNADGTTSSELTITVEVDELNNGRPTVIPTIIAGKKLTDEEAIHQAISSKLDYPGFNTLQEAEDFAKNRSKTGGASTYGFLGKAKDPLAILLGRLDPPVKNPETPIPPSMSAGEVASDVFSSVQRSAGLGATNATQGFFSAARMGMGYGMQLAGAPEDVSDVVSEEAQIPGLSGAEEYLGLLEQGVEDSFPADPRLDGSFLGRTVPEALGSTIPMALASVAGGPAAGALTAMGQEAQSQKEAAQSYGANKDTQQAAFLLGLPLGATEILAEPVGLLRKLPIVDKLTQGFISKYAKSRIVSNAVEMTSAGLFDLGQESGQQIGSNAIARLYDENRGLLDGLLDAGGAGFLVGSFLRGVALAAKAGKRTQDVAQGKKPEPITPVEKKALALTKQGAEAIAKDAPAVAQKIVEKTDPPTRKDIKELTKAVEELKDMAYMNEAQRKELQERLRSLADEAMGGRVTRLKDEQGNVVWSREDASSVRAVGKEVSQAGQVQEEGTGVSSQDILQQDIQAGRPQATPQRNLANPAITPAARDFVDQVREKQGTPEVRGDEQVFAEAQERLNRDYEGEKTKVLSGEYINPRMDASIVVAKQLIEKETVEALLSGDETKLAEAQQIIENYTEQGTEVGRQFRQRRDEVLTPAQRIQNNVAEALVVPDQKTQKQIDKIKKQEKKKESKLGKKAKEAKAELGKAVDDLGEFLKGRTFANPLDPELVSKIASVAAKALKVVGYTFSDFVAELTKRLGRATVVKLNTAIQEAWTKAGGKEATDVESVIKVREESDRVKQLRKAWARKSKKIAEDLTAAGFDIEKALTGTLEDQIAGAQLIGQIHAAKADVWDKMYEYWINSILSGTQTGIVNVVGGATYGPFVQIADRMAESVVAGVARSMGIKKDGARLGEVKHVLRGYFNGLGTAARNFMLTWKTEIPQFNLMVGKSPSALFEYRTPSIKGKKGRLIRMPTRFIIATDDFVKSVLFAGERHGLAYRQAKEEGLEGQEQENRIQEILADPQHPVNLESAETALELAFQKERPRVQNFAQWVRSIWGGRYVVPFIPTIANLIGTGIKRADISGINISLSIRKAIQTGDWSKVDKAVVETMLAWGVLIAFAASLDPEDPWVTGTEHPTHPQSVRINGQYYSYTRIEPWATAIGMLVDTVMKIKTTDDKLEVVVAPFFSLLNQLDMKSFLDGAADLYKMFEQRSINPGIDWASNFVASWIPNLYRSVARSTEEELPMRRNWGKSIEERGERALRRAGEATELPVPWDTYPKRDIWGRPVPRDGGPIPATDFLWRILFPAQVKGYQPTDGDKLIYRWNVMHPDERVAAGFPLPSYREDDKTYYMTEQEYDKYLETAGTLALERLNKIQNGSRPLNIEQPTKKDRDKIEEILQDAREKAKRLMRKQGLLSPAP